MEIRMEVDKETLNRVLNYVGTTICLLSEHDYWKKQLWRNVGNHKDDREAEIHNAFFAIRIAQMGVYSTPLAQYWHHTSPEELHKMYYEKYEDIWKDYEKWLRANGIEQYYVSNS
jgi:hypothetical protein